nr:MAG TPA: hypothetical protein [Caudoviricetes sp.]
MGAQPGQHAFIHRGSPPTWQANDSKPEPLHAYR